MAVPRDLARGSLSPTLRERYQDKEATTEIACAIGTGGREMKRAGQEDRYDYSLGFVAAAI